jgi:putative SOS response-associated peptidase YedK
MCGLIKQSGSPEMPFPVDNRFETPEQLHRVSDATKWKPRYNAAPSQELLVFRRDPVTGTPAEGYLRWGLIPHWMKARPEIQPYNARAESVAERKMFAEAYAKRRCIVPMEAFYEWERVKGKKGRCYAFGFKDHSSFGVAGIWENWRDPMTGEWERTFAIITVTANELVAKVHDRMPVILRNEDHARWLGPETDPRDLLKPYPTEPMMMWPISNRVNSLANDDPSVAAPIDQPTML